MSCIPVAFENSQELSILDFDDVDVLPDPNHNEESIADSRVRRAARIVDSATINGKSILDQLEIWREQDRLAALEGQDSPANLGGRPRNLLSVRAVLVALVVLALDQKPLLLTKVYELLTKRISPKMCDEIGAHFRMHVITDGSAKHQKAIKNADYAMIWRRMQDILEPIEPYEYPRNRRLTNAEFAKYKAKWSTPENMANIEMKSDRLDLITGALLDVTFLSIPRDIRRRYKGAIAIDESALPLAARGPSKRSDKKSIEPHGEWVMRSDEKSKLEQLAKLPDGLLRSRTRTKYAMGAMMAVAGSSDPDNQDFPVIVTALKLGPYVHDISPRVASVLKSLSRRGYPADLLVADRGILPNAKPEDVQLLTKQLDYLMVFDYRKDQLGKMDTYEGAILVEGQWYCPMMPKPLINATITFQASAQTDADFTTWMDRLIQRQRYALRPNERSRPGESVDMVCPAFGPSPTARCEMRPTSLDRKHAGKTRIPVTPTSPGKICTNKHTVAFPPSAGAKYAQTFPYALEKWDKVYRLLRNYVEGYNGYMKDPAYQDLGAPGRRRLRGLAAQSLLSCLGLVAANLRKIETFIAEAEPTSEGVLIKISERKPSPHRLRYDAYFDDSDLANARSA
ncbi:MAG TPA: hypothetical protein VMU99_03170 [Acidimicrobiales bacterium]|nr:hypothetical protein [Acidimicrobiales bacterium]